MSIDEAWQARVENLLNCSLDVWIESALSTEYRRHFHKNYASGCKTEMRKLWSVNLTRANEIPSALRDISFVSENMVKYTVTDRSTGYKTEELATTLPGILNRDLPSVAGELYDHIMEKDSHLCWENRGPRIFREVSGWNADFEGAADLILLDEYDVHEGSAVYRDTGALETFPEAMHGVGYSGLLLNGPVEEESSGIGVFWREDVFCLAGTPDKAIERVPGEHAVLALDTGKSHHGAFNYDLMERWHQRLPSSVSGQSVCVHMAKKDRRNVGFVRLRHRQSNCIVLVVPVHLMTESRDCASTNEFPGERAAKWRHRKRSVLSFIYFLKTVFDFSYRRSTCR